MADAHEERLNVYDAEGVVVGAMPRREAKRSGRAVGAVNLLLATAGGQVLLQQRPSDKENPGRWDKSVGGHVGAGESFDAAAVREAGEELFDDPASPRVILAPDEPAFRDRLAIAELQESVVFRRVSLQRNLRDVRRTVDERPLEVMYHVAVYLGRTEMPLERFRPQASEIAGLGYFAPRAVDEMLLRGQLAPNMAFLWLTHAYALLGQPPPSGRT